jgi:hypothetical protein
MIGERKRQEPKNAKGAQCNVWANVLSKRRAFLHFLGDLLGDYTMIKGRYEEKECQRQYQRRCNIEDTR